MSRLDEEFHHHIDLTTQDLIAEGVAPHEARLEAMRRFGSVAHYRRQCQRVEGSSRFSIGRGFMLETILHDVRYATRTLRRYPAFLLATVITLTVGIGASTAIYSVVDTVVLRSLPYAEANRLVQAGTMYGGRDQLSSSSPMNFFDWRERSDAFEMLVGSRMQSMILTGSGDPEPFTAAGVSHDYFELLGWSPFVGRDILPSDDRPGGNRVVVLGYGVWQRRWGGDRSIVGRTLTLSGSTYEVVGVMPPGFLPPEAIHYGGVDMWFPLAFVDDDLTSRDNGFLQVIGRLNAGRTVQQAGEALTALQRNIYRELGTDSEGLAEFRDGQRVGVATLHEQTVGEARGNLLIFLGAVGFLLMIACANVANLFLVRATDRDREMAVRTALGANRGRLTRQLLTEGLVTALIGGAGGVALAVGGVRVFRALAPEGIPRVAEVTVDARVLVFTLVVAIVTGLAFGLIPSLNQRFGIAGSLKDGTTQTTLGRRGKTLRQTLVVSEVAIALVLMVGAGLLVNSFVRRSTSDPGFDPENVVRLALFLDGYETGESRVAFFEELIARARAVPGVVSAAATNNLPMTRNRSLSGVTAEARAPRETDPSAVEMHSVTTDFFETLSVPLIRGRTFDPSDGAGEPVAVINAAMADLFWDGDAVGRRFKFGDADSPGAWITVLGVVGDIHQRGLGEQSGPALYQIHQQRPFIFGNLIVRTGVESGGTIAALREAVWAVDPNLAIEESGTLVDQMRGTVTEPRFYTWLLTGFASVALILAAVGIYGTVAFSVARRSREIGIRMAFGAAGRHVRRLIIRQGAAMTGAGLAIGLVGATLLSRTLSQLVYDIGTMDLPTYTVVALALFAVGILASWFPARRATRVAPMQTLRME